LVFRAIRLGNKLLKSFINQLLSTIHHDDSLKEIPTPDYWSPEVSEDGFIELDSWDPPQTSRDVYKVIALLVMSDPGTPTPIYP
jgi:hypothetical protein